MIMNFHQLIIIPQGRLELPRNLIHQILSLTRINHFRHTGIYYRSGGIRTLNPFLSRPPGLSRRCIPIPITDRYLAEARGIEPPSRFLHGTLAKCWLTNQPTLPFLSSERDSNPHGISTTRLSFSRGYQLLHMTLFSVQWDSNPHCTRSERVDSCQLVYKPLICYRPEGTRTPNPRLSRPPGLSRCCIPIPITDRLQPYPDSNREQEIWSHLGYQLPHRAI